MIFVDTNYFLRLLIGDNAKQQLEAKQLFKQGAAGKVKLFSSAVVFLEIYWVMSSFYGKNKQEIIKILENVLKLDFVKWENEKLLRTTLEMFKHTGLDLEDSYNLIYAGKMKAKKFKTFDLKLLRQFEKK
ncbi:PIN domain-containing protein [Microgenomates group bacterium]|nr:PIN domain-containing protein [Microgenomates group bacterium]